LGRAVPKRRAGLRVWAPRVAPRGSTVSVGQAQPDPRKACGGVTLGKRAGDHTPSTHEHRVCVLCASPPLRAFSDRSPRGQRDRRGAIPRLAPSNAHGHVMAQQTKFRPKRCSARLDAWTELEDLRAHRRLVGSSPSPRIDAADVTLTDEAPRAGVLDARRGRVRRALLEPGGAARHPLPRLDGGGPPELAAFGSRRRLSPDTSPASRALSRKVDLDGLSIGDPATCPGTGAHMACISCASV